MLRFFKKVGLNNARYNDMDLEPRIEDDFKWLLYPLDNKQLKQDYFWVNGQGTRK
jgi:hypothetical protein